MTFLFAASTNPTEVKVHQVPVGRGLPHLSTVDGWNQDSKGQILASGSRGGLLVKLPILT